MYFEGPYGSLSLIFGTTEEYPSGTLYITPYYLRGTLTGGYQLQRATISIETYGNHATPEFDPSTRDFIYADNVGWKTLTGRLDAAVNDDYAQQFMESKRASLGSRGLFTQHLNPDGTPVDAYWSIVPLFRNLKITFAGGEEFILVEAETPITLAGDSAAGDIHTIAVRQPYAYGDPYSYSASNGLYASPSEAEYFSGFYFDLQVLPDYQAIHWAVENSYADYATNMASSAIFAALAGTLPRQGRIVEVTTDQGTRILTTHMEVTPGYDWGNGSAWYALDMQTEYLQTEVVLPFKDAEQFVQFRFVNMQPVEYEGQITADLENMVDDLGDYNAVGSIIEEIIQVDIHTGAILLDQWSIIAENSQIEQPDFYYIYGDAPPEEEPEIVIKHSTLTTTMSPSRSRRRLYQLRGLDNKPV